MRLIKNLELPIDTELSEHLAWLIPNHGPYGILRQSVDARRRHSPHFVYTVEIADEEETLKVESFSLEKITFTGTQKGREKPLIIGTGPAGLFAALRLAERGIPTLIFERGSESGQRIRGINRYWRYGELDPRNNVCFGEGGAGLYSDGKLITRIKSPHIPYVLNRLVQFGAPEEIQWLSNPHVGSDRIRRVIPKLRNFLIGLGCEFHFDTQVTELLVEGKNVCGIRTERGQTFHSSQVVLATGHSAQDIFSELQNKGVFVEGKSFAVGLRVEHPQEKINQIQYREFAHHPKLGSANYKLTYHDPQTSIGTYSFCMCPGGFVLSSGTESDGLVCNGMSNYHRNSKWANAAIVATIDFHQKFGATASVMAGLEYRRTLEQRAFRIVQAHGGTKQLPAQPLMSFLSNQKEKGRSPTPRNRRDNGSESTMGSSPSGALHVPLQEILDPDLVKSLQRGFDNFEKNMKGFICEEGLLYGVESRTSCPIRITRDSETLQSISHTGLYPVGEGAGYAGGITSAACDGIRIAEKIYESWA